MKASHTSRSGHTTTVNNNEQTAIAQKKEYRVFSKANRIVSNMTHKVLSGLGSALNTFLRGCAGIQRGCRKLESRLASKTYELSNATSEIWQGTKKSGSEVRQFVSSRAYQWSQPLTKPLSRATSKVWNGVKEKLSSGIRILSNITSKAAPLQLTLQSFPKIEETMDMGIEPKLTNFKLRVPTKDESFVGTNVRLLDVNNNFVRYQPSIDGPIQDVIFNKDNESLHYFDDHKNSFIAIRNPDNDVMHYDSENGHFYVQGKNDVKKRCNPDRSNLKDYNARLPSKQRSR